jgi:hypothetical protein
MLVMTLLVGAFAGGVFVLVVEGHAQRAERIYRARHRDHSSVPAIRGNE